MARQKPQLAATSNTLDASLAHEPSWLLPICAITITCRQLRTFEPTTRSDPELFAILPRHGLADVATHRKRYQTDITLINLDDQMTELARSPSTIWKIASLSNRGEGPLRRVGDALAWGYPRGTFESFSAPFFMLSLFIALAGTPGSRIDA